MNIFPAAYFLVLSANAGAVLGSGVRGTGLEIEQEKKGPTRNLSESGLFGGSKGDRDNVPDDRVSLDNEIDGGDEDGGAESIEEPPIDSKAPEDDNGGPDDNGSRARGYSYHGGNSYHNGGGSSYNDRYSGSSGGGSSNYGGYSGSSGGGSPYRGEDSNSSYHKHWNKGCRTYYGGKGSSHNDFDLYNDVDKHFCKRKCDSLGHHCYGYEYSNSGRCEVWKVPIINVEYVYGHDCYKK